MPLDSISNLLPGLMPARWRGVDFHMPDTSTAAGRRLAQHLFPGINSAAYDDMGMSPEEITVSGILLGDDYIAQAQRLRSAFKTPGPSTLMHPWLGGLNVILETPGEISFSDKELRVARFHATFKVISQRIGFNATGLTTSRVFSAVNAAISIALLIGNIRTNVYTKAITRTKRITNSAFSSMAILDNADFLSSLNDQFETLKNESVVLESPVGVAAEAETKLSKHTPETLFNLLSKGVWQLLDELSNTPSMSDQALLGAVSTIALAHASNLTPHIVFTTRKEAIYLREALSKQIANLQDRLAPNINFSNLQLFAPLMSELDRALIELNSSIHADINEAIGRLPVLHRLNIDKPVDAFAIAHHLYGDTPDLVEKAYQSIIARNNTRHPAALAEGIVEVER